MKKGQVNYLILSSKKWLNGKLNELTQNYQKLQGNYNELSANYINMKKEIDSINKGQEEMKTASSELKNTVEGSKAGLMKQRIGSANWRARKKKNMQNEQEKERRLRKNEEG